MAPMTSRPQRLAGLIVLCALSGACRAADPRHPATGAGAGADDLTGAVPAVDGAMGTTASAASTLEPPTVLSPFDIPGPGTPWPTDELVEVTANASLTLPPLTPMPPPPTPWGPGGWSDLGPPRSQPAEIGRTYEHRSSHCGVHHSVDFDGSYWVITAQSDDPHSVSANSVVGTITLESRDVALYRAGAFAARLARLEGTMWGRGCF